MCFSSWWVLKLCKNIVKCCEAVVLKPTGEKRGGLSSDVATVSNDSKNVLCLLAVFQGEGGSDYGGLFRETMTVLGDELMNRVGNLHLLSLFVETPNFLADVGSGRDKLVPNPQARSSAALDDFYCVGLLMGGSVFSDTSIPLRLVSLVWKVCCEPLRWSCDSMVVFLFSPRFYLRTPMVFLAGLCWVFGILAVPCWRAIWG